MPSISETIYRLRAAKTLDGSATDHANRLRPLESFGSNPGALKGWHYVPPNCVLAGLVVVLHGCTQTASSYDVGSGWSELADQHGFAVLFPEQVRENNPSLCFNWFNPEDTRRGRGEAASVRHMIACMLGRHSIDPTRVFITGLSAGGAMTSVMLATYPELFAGGGIIAGLPYGAAASVPEALQRMRDLGHPDGQEYGKRLRGASPHAGPWPKISVWHGDADHIVSPANADHIADQWRAVHGLGAVPDRVETIGRQSHRIWLDSDGDEVLEVFHVAGMGHGTPLRTVGPDGCGRPGPHMIEVGISSTRILAAHWGLLGDKRAARASLVATRPTRVRAPEGEPRRDSGTSSASNVQTIIEDALRAAGLMK